MAVFKNLLCQVVAGLLLLFGYRWIAGWNLQLWQLALCQGIIAAGLCTWLQQPVWWRVIHLLFFPAIVVMQGFNLPPWVYLLVFLLLSLVFWGTVKGDVPLFLSSTAVVDAVLKILAEENAGSFVDIGAGLATVVAPVARQMPDLRIDALERAPLPWLYAYWRCRGLSNVNVRLCSLWRSNLADYSVVFAFLSPLVMAGVAEKVMREMRAGSLFISSSFPLPEYLPENVIRINDRQKTCLYCYRIKAK